MGIFRRKAIAPEACATAPARGGKKRSTAAMVLLCAHCSLTVFGAIAALGLAAIPASIALGIKWVLPPFFLLGLLLFVTRPAFIFGNPPQSSAEARTPKTADNPQDVQG